MNYELRITNYEEDKRKVSSRQSTVGRKVPLTTHYSLLTKDEY